MRLYSQSPLNALREWFDKLPPDVRTDVCWQSYTFGPTGLFPELGSGTHGAAEVEAFRAVLNREPRAPMDEAGTVIVLAALVDFAFVNRSTKEQWDEAEVRLKRASDYATERGFDSMLATATMAGTRLPFRAGMWIREAETWNGLRSGSLSAANLFRWMMTVPTIGE